jgi:hypothetical protein
VAFKQYYAPENILCQINAGQGNLPSGMVSLHGSLFVCACRLAIGGAIPSLQSGTAWLRRQ